MNKRAIFLYWFLLLVPALVISAAVWQLLRHERERIDREALYSAQDRARTMTETMQITIAEVEDELTRALLRLPEPELQTTLSRWAETNPLVRNVFIWDPETGLEYPASDGSATAEEKRFTVRYDALFSGRHPWPSAGLETSSSPPAGAAGDTAKLKTGRQSLLSLARNRDESISVQNQAPRAARPGAGGWIPWFAENGLYILGWVQPEKQGRVYGLELELMTLLSRLITDFPVSVPPGLVYALLDGNGQILHQTGDSQLDPAARPDAALSLAPYLPHWQVAVYLTGSSSTFFSGRGFIILTGLLLTIFLAAVLLGGALLTWQAHRNMLDARRKTTFVSNVSHELKTPLTSIRMYAELLSGDRVNDPEKTRKYLGVIVEESHRLTRLVNNVLDFSRLEQGRKNYHLEPIDLNGFIRELLENHNLRVAESGLALLVSLPEGQALVRTDRDALGQALLNLIDNAVKYAADGGELGVELQPGPEYHEIRILDRGPGVPVEHRARIFKKFHRVDDSLTARQPGSGLGLSIAQRLMRDMGGDILFEPRRGGGSIFIIKIPVNSRKTRS